MKTILAALSVSALAITQASAISLTFSAQQGTGIGDSPTGAALSGTNVEVGIWNGSAFASLGLTTSGVPLDGLFGGTSKFDSQSIGTAQYAMRISNNGGAVIAFAPAWNTAFAGDGGGTDFNTAAIDLVEVIQPGGSLVGSIVIDPAAPNTIWALPAAGNTTHSGLTNPTFSTPSLEVGVVPEPSTYAMLAGALALVAVMIRRRK